MQPSVSLFSSDASPARRRWTGVALRCGALLVVPFAVWLALPAPPSIAPRPTRPHRGDDGESAVVTPVTTAAQSPLARAAPAVAATEGTTPAAVSGEVQDPDGKPVGHASVSCTVAEHELEAFSDDAGHFELDAAAIGCVAVARKEHFGPSVEETLTAGSTNKLRLTPPMGIAGNVVDESGAPVVIYMLSIASFEPAAGGKDGGRGAAPRNLTIDDASGAFEWTELGAGRYALAVSVREGPLSRSQSVEVSPGAMTRGVSIVVHPGVIVVGQITDAATHAPLDGARVFVDMGGLLVRSGPSRTGEFKLEGAPAGRFDLSVYRRGYSKEIVRDLQSPARGETLHVDVALHSATEDPAPRAE